LTGRPERRTILVVEDNTDELLIYTTLLGFRGYAVLAAATYDEALRLATTHPPDLAIIDVNLNDEQDRDGCDLVCALHDDERTRDVPVIAHTAFSDVYHESLHRLGCAAIMHKPSSPAALLAAIERLIGPADAEAAQGEADLIGKAGITVEEVGPPDTDRRSEDAGSPFSSGDAPGADAGPAAEDAGSD
jgi:two-component system, cell cycle response regulator DivK